ncbi:shikimate kinase [Spongiibacter sp. KMU-158]|uniref:Shikimate kinase n=1 Tax=Spongiibacter pelagi TaxID=2760804 RepID=A0A927C1D1_9GAMM|nr:shikimate kinase [Spongiibacter pelagi]MBD2858006.1 shikimate kinase [Spongiibacter pelagi]
MNSDDAIILIGMPASGKSTLGRMLAARLRRKFVDTDTLIETATGEPLQHTLDREGYLKLRDLEEQAILAEDFHSAIVATGGSAVYSEAAMAHLRQFGPLVFLDVPLTELNIRLSNFGSRGIASAPGSGLADIYADRQPRYLRTADYQINVTERSETEAVNAILEMLGLTPSV